MKKVILTICIMFFAVEGFGQWFQQNSGTGSNLNSIYCASKDTVFTCGTNGTILRTTNGGTTWETLNNGVNNLLKSTSFVNKEIGFTCGENIILKTTDHGENWFLVCIDTVVPISVFSSSFFPNADTGFVVGNSAIFSTMDGGTNWLQRNPSVQFAYTELLSVFFPTNKIGYTVGFQHGLSSDAGLIGKTIDSGNNWFFIAEPFHDLKFINKYLLTVFFIDSLKGWVGEAGCNPADYRRLFKTTDGGINWDTLATPFFYSINSIFFPNEQIGFVGDALGQIYNTIDSGTSWQLQVYIPNKSINSIYCIDSNICYAVGDSGLILKTTNGGIGVEENQLPVSAINIYPNPAIDNIIIETHETATIEIHNLQGQLIKTIKTEGKETTIDVASLASGVYIIKAVMENGVAIHKFIKQ